MIVAVSGLSSNTGKTTLVCDLLRRLPGWEAIKVTRGHYRSCGKDPEGCCVSDLLRDEPLIRSGRAGNYEAGKDTGMFWDAGAANVHWLIATDDQIGPGIREALSRVKAAGVLVEGNSFAEFVDVDLFVMVRRADDAKIKKSAKQVLSRADEIYVSDEEEQSAVKLIERIRCLVNCVEKKGAGSATA